MNCPKCQEKLAKEPYRHRNYLLCFYCEGVWLSKADIAAHGLINAADAIKKPSPHSCPACVPKQQLALVSIQGCELERCAQCEGMFFDKGELESFFTNYTALDGKALALEAGKALLTLFVIKRVVVSLFRFIDR